VAINVENMEKLAVNIDGAKRPLVDP